MFKLQRLEISGFKSFADYTEIVFTGSGITAVVGPNGCGKSNVSDAMSWVLGEQRAKSLRGGEMKDVVFAGTRSRKPGGMAEVVLHLVRDDIVVDQQDSELVDIDEALSDIDEHRVELENFEPLDDEIVTTDEVRLDEGDEEVEETALAAQVGSIQTIQTKVRTKRHWRPRSFALDFAPGEAVSVTRRLYLSGESEYQLNGKTCRLRDITDLFAGTGLSGSHYAIIEQGRIGQILSAKPADRRNLIEEAAGISKFRARQRAAESRLDSAKSNLGRIGDIVSEIEKQVNSLRRQAAKTRRFKILQEEFRDLLRQLYAAEGKYLSNLLGQLERELLIATETETSLLQQVEEKEAGARESTQAARTAEETLSELRRVLANNALERDRAEREHGYKSDQIVNLGNRSEALSSEISGIDHRLAGLASELERLRADEKEESGKFSAAELELRESEAAFRSEAEQLASIERTLETLRSSLMQHTGASERFDEIARQLENNLERLTMRAAGLKSEGERAVETFTSNQKHAEELQASLAVEEAKLRDLNTEKLQLASETAAAREQLRSAEAELRAVLDEHAAKRHRLATLLELEEKRAVYTPQVQKLFAAQKTIGVKFSGVLADLLEVDTKAETAVETLFGNFLQAVIVDSVDDAAKVSAWLKESQVGRAAMLIMPGGVEAAAGTSGSENTIARVLGINDEVAGVLSRIFPREMAATLIENISGASFNDEQMVVDYEGNVLIGGRMLIGGKANKGGKNDSLLAFKRELNHLEAEVRGLESRVETGRGGVDKAKSALVDIEGRTVDLQSLIIKVDRGIHGLQIQVQTAREEIARAERHRKVVEDEAGQIALEMEELKTRRTDALATKTSADEARAETESNLEAIYERLAEAKASADAASSVLSDKRMAAATSDERRRSAVNALRRVETDQKELEARLEQQRTELSESEAKLAELKGVVAEIGGRLAASPQEIAGEEEVLAVALTALTAAREISDRTSEELAELNRLSADARNQRAALEIRQAEAITQLKNTNDNCHQELNIALTDLIETVELSEELQLPEVRRSADDLRQRLENFGAINMLALEELGETEERHQFLSSQKQDIIDSIAATEEALREIKQRSREKFKSAFEAINANFMQFFQELFGGGRGEMSLLDAEDVLEAGIEVVAQPPGKRLQNILLLSGGEKAMTAIALVLAIFKYRPSPFCLLDEVDAPLDDANVGRFAAKIAEMSERTQFIVITHNKRTMEFARALYGVTMQEAGVSKIVSVKFD